MKVWNSCQNFTKFLKSYSINFLRKSAWGSIMSINRTYLVLWGTAIGCYDSTKRFLSFLWAITQFISNLSLTLSFSVKRRPPSFLMQTKLIWIPILTSNSWFYDFNATSFHFFEILDVFFILLVHFEILWAYHITDISHLLRKTIKGS